MSRRPPLRARLAAVLSPQPYTGRGAPIWAQAGLIMMCAIIFGFQFVAFKAAFRGMGPLTLLALRAILALPLLYLVMRWTGIRVVVTRRNLALVSIPAALLTGSQIFFMFGVHRLAAGLTATLVSMLPIFSLALGYAFRLERVGPLSIVGAAASAVGVAIATGAASGHVDRLGLILILVSNLFYALNFIAYRKLSLPLSSGLFLMVTMAQLAIVLTPLALVFEGFSIRWTWKVTLSALYAGVFGQVVAYIGVMTLVRLGGIFQSTLVTPLIPVWAIFFAVLLLGEPLLGRELVGGALIIGGVVLAILPSGRGGGAFKRGDRPRSIESTSRAEEHA